MSVPLRVPLFGVEPGLVELPEETARYVASVHRLGVGAELSLFDPARVLRGSGTIERMHKGRVFVHVDEVQPGVSNAMPVCLFQSLGKGEKPDQAVRDATVLGATHVVFVATERSVVRQVSESKNDRLERIAVEAARQCGRDDLPVVVGALAFEEALEVRPLSSAIAFALDVRATSFLDALGDWSGERELSLWIGPEGGFSKAEVGRLFEGGARLASLGPLVLRTEVAVTVALGVARQLASRSSSACPD